MKAIAPIEVLSEVPKSPLVELLDGDLAEDFDELPRHLWEKALGAPAREFLRRPGKRFRAQLVECAWLIAGGDAKAMPSDLPKVIEILHAGSLIVDDIEDDSDSRRDAPALHKIYGVPQALNTGNWMYFWALRLLDELPLADVSRYELLRSTSRTVERCHRGQALDLSMKVSRLKQADVAPVVRTTTKLKTGALVELAAAFGGVAAGADSEKLAALRCFGRRLGDGLQMLDDLGGITSESRFAKAAEDFTLERPTWNWAWLSHAVSSEEFTEFQLELRSVSRGEVSHHALARRIRAKIEPQARQRIHSSLHLSLADLELSFGHSPYISALRSELDRLEQSYE